MLYTEEKGSDIGTANILNYSKTKGVVLNESSVIAIENNRITVDDEGKEAKEMIGKTPKNIVPIRPLREGVIADYDVTAQMLKALLKKVSKKMGLSMRKPVVIVCTPTGST